MASETIHTVFVSSTYEDLKEERALVQKAILTLKCFPVGMELFGSASDDTWEFIKKRIDECDYYILILAGKYGSIGPSGLGYTEMEYDYAKSIGKPINAFLYKDLDSLIGAKIEKRPSAAKKLLIFREKIKGASPVSFYGSPLELAQQVTFSMVNTRESHPAPGFIRADDAPDLKKYTEALEQIERLRAELALRPAKPQFKLSADPDQGCLITPVTIFVQGGSGIRSKISATVIRILAIATTETGPRNVAAFLTRVERNTDSGFEPSPHHEMLPLEWAGTDTREVDISDKFPRHANVLQVDHFSSQFTVPGVGMSESLGRFMQNPGTYRATVSVMAEGQTNEIRFEIDWDGTWEGIAMREL